MSTECCDFYCDLTKLESLEENCRKAIMKFTDYYNDLDSAVQTVKTGDSKGSYWQGKSFNDFMTAFTFWQKSYLNVLNMLIIFDSSLVLIYNAVAELIEERDKLIHSLE